MIDSDTVVKHQGNERKIRLLLVTKDSERIKFLFEEEIFWKNEMADISQINMKEMTRVYGEEKTGRMMRVIMENNVTMLKLQKQIIELQVVEEERKRKQKRRQKEREQERREYEERWEEEEQRRQKEKKKVNEE